jgi:putative transposase
MIKTLKVRLYPDENQRILLEKHFGSCRFVWNHFLEVRNKYYVEHKKDKKKGLTAFDTMKMLTALKREITWLNEINSQSLQHSLVELDKAFKSFFKHNTAYPTFKSKKDKQCFIIPSGFKAIGNKLIIPKFTEGIEYRDKSSIPENIKQIIVTRDVDRYYASIQYETSEQPMKGEGAIGIDMGIKHFLTTSDGIQIEPLNILRKKEKKLKREQRRLSAKKKGSKNRRKQRVKVQKIHQQIRDARMDFNHKVSTAIAKHYGTVVIEDLNIQGMTQNHELAKSITDQGWYQFRKMLEYKLGWKNADLIEIGRFDPSSKMCSRCGNIKHDLKLSDRVYHCNVCGLSMDRDLNAAINVLQMGFIKVGKGIPEFTPAEIPLAGYLNHEGISYVSLNQEPQNLQG